ncbi:hypothetical protein [Actinomadura citrea]|uniref:Uncharacterized protein n=1 Tax=Actinomadura citrea TaxID=46158 RepID=A0A7Y9GAZ9_9ACTN|nr:hypothetical protein [Actinomadura citrea]NYE13234.1 hypothetical protein [Actinomadura citrea]
MSEASHHETHFTPKRTVIDQRTGQLVKAGTVGCPCGWTAPGSENDFMAKFAEHLAEQRGEES